jgi:aerobic carbon-monoxide dehydrogenase small subunit
MTTTMTTATITLTVNGERVKRTVPTRQHLIDFLRADLGLTGSHVACEHGVCGACTVRVDGLIARGCLVLAASLDGSTVETIEGVSDTGEIRDLQDSFMARNAAQCGYCTPAMLLTGADILAPATTPSSTPLRRRRRRGPRKRNSGVGSAAAWRDLCRLGQATWRDPTEQHHPARPCWVAASP